METKRLDAGRRRCHQSNPYMPPFQVTKKQFHENNYGFDMVNNYGFDMVIAE